MPFFSDVDVDVYLKEVGFNLPVPVLGVDDGFDQINLAYWIVKDGALSIGESKIKSRAKPGRHITQMTGGGVAGLFSSEGEEFTVRESLNDPQDTRTDEYPESTLNRVLVHAALFNEGLTGGQRVALVTGLPISVFQKSDGTPNEALIDAKMASMEKPVYVGMKERVSSASVTWNGVYPEAIAGMVDYMIGDDGLARPGIDPNETRMALDVGGNTTDMAIILPGNEVGAVKTVELGVSHIRDRLKSLIEDRFSMRCDTMLVDKALMTRKVNFFGEGEQDITELWNEAASQILQEILRHADVFRKKYPSMTEMVGFGGGIALCEDLIRERFKAIKLVDNPDGANARGYLKVASFDCRELIQEEIGFLAGPVQSEPVEA